MGRKKTKKDTAIDNTGSNEQEMAISQKLDILIDVVANMGKQVKKQDVRLQKQE